MPSMKRNWLGLAAAFAVTAIAPLVGARVSRPGRWYRSLRKPPHNPPSWVFGPVWSVLYTLSALSIWRVWQQPPSRPRRAAMTLWAVQHGLNAAWSPLFFGAHRPRLALVDLGLMLPTAIAYNAVAGKVDRSAAWLVAPYTGWLAFALSLNAGVVAKNPGLG
jgi:translocator protein